MHWSSHLASLGPPLGCGYYRPVRKESNYPAYEAVNEMRRVLVAGATGHLGKEVLRELKERGHWVRVLLRDPLKPTHPAEPPQIVFPSTSVMVINVLLNVAFICTTAFATFFLTFRFTPFAILTKPFCIIFYRASFTLFLPATVFLGPLRVLAFVFVR